MTADRDEMFTWSADAAQGAAPRSIAMDSLMIEDDFEPINDDGAAAIGTYVRLRPLDTSDYEALYWIEQDPSTAQRFRHRAHAVAPERYPDMLWHGVATQYAIDSNRDGSLVGLVGAYGVDEANGHARLSVMIRPDLHRAAWPLEAVGLFVDHVFASFPWRKLYCEVTEAVYDQFAASEGVGFEVEGRLIAHHWVEGRWADMLVLAIHRDRWSDRMARLGPSLTELFDAELAADESAGSDEKRSSGST